MRNPEQGLIQSYLGIERTAQSCDVSQKTVKRWLDQGLAFYQAGHKSKILIDPADIRAFLTQRQKPKPVLDAMVEEVMGDLQRGKG